MSVRWNKRWHVLPFTWLNWSRSGFSWTFRAGPLSRNSRTRRVRVDLPGPFYRR